MNTEQFKFPGGEVHVRLVDTEDYSTSIPVTISARIRCSDDIMTLLLQTDALRRAGWKDIDLLMPYVPYARQDRVMVPGEPLSAKVFCDLINAQKYRCVEIWDPHSDVTPALLNNCEVVPQHSLLYDMLDLLAPKDTVLVCPDAGARKKVLAAGKALGLTNIVYADKKRDVETGRITGTVISDAPEDWHLDADHLIADDIADGGATFIELAKVLREKGVTGNVNLYVTHGIFSKGFEPFEGLIDNIYMANSWHRKEVLEAVNARGKVQVTSAWPDESGILF